MALIEYMEKYYQQQYRLLVVNNLLKIAQTLDNSKNLQKSTTQQATDFLSSQSDRLEEKVGELVHSPEVYRLLEDKFKQLFSKSIEEFIINNKQNASTYLSNPDVLMKDIEQQVPLVKYINWLDNALDAIMIVSSIISLVSIIGSFGAASGVAVPAEAAKWSARGLIKKFIQKEGLNLLIKLFARQVIIKIPSLIAKTSISFSKNFIQQALLQIKLIFVSDILLSVLKTTSINALKDIIATKGAEQLNLPRDLISQLVAEQTDQQAMEQILSDFKTKVAEDLQKLFTTQQGLSNLAFNAAILTVCDMINIKPELLKKNILLNIKLALKDTSLAGAAQKFIDKKKQLFQKPLEHFNKQALENMLKQQGIPSFLIENYYQALTHEAMEKNIEQDSDKLKDLATKLVSKAALNIYNLQDNIRELITIDFIVENKDKLQKNPSALQNLLRDVSDIQTTSLEELLSQAKATSLDSLLKSLTQQKKYLINALAENLALSSSTKIVDQVAEYFNKQANAKSYKKNLYDSIFLE